MNADPTKLKHGDRVWIFNRSAAADQMENYPTEKLVDNVVNNSRGWLIGVNNGYCVTHLLPSQVFTDRTSAVQSRIAEKVAFANAQLAECREMANKLIPADADQATFIPASMQLKKAA